MKRRFLILPVLMLGLSSCEFSFSLDLSGMVSSSASGQEQATSYSLPVTHNDGITPVKMAQTYGDYAENCIYPIDSAPTEGEVRLLVIPVWFTDSSSFIQNKDKVRSDIGLAYFGTKEDTGWHSVKSFYEAESRDAVTISGTVSPWYSCSRKSSYYGQDEDGRTTKLVKTATDWYFTSTGEDPQDYDGDGDGYLDGVMLIYGAPDWQSNKSDNNANLWAYCFWVQDSTIKNPAKPGVNTYFWASYDFMYQSGLNTRTLVGSAFGAGDCRFCKIDAHTYIHEMGHVFGLDDYYDYGDGGYSPAGSFSMQDMNIGGHDPFSLLSFGWVEPYIPKESTTIQIRSFQDSGDLILLTPSWNDFDSPFDEYLLLELYTPTGLNAFDSTHKYMDAYPQGPSVTGIRVWHVDARLLYLESNGLFSAKQMTCDSNRDSYYGVAMAFSNSYDDDDYGSPLGKNYDDYDLLHLIRNYENMKLRTKDVFSSDDLFVNGSVFTMKKFYKQFPRGTSLDNGKSLGWSFTVSITGSGTGALASINLTKN